MPWAQVDDLFPDHPKIRPLSDAAFRVHVAAICYCNRHLTDGVLVGHDQTGLSRVTSAELSAAVTELVTADVWTRTETGYLLHDFLDWNPSRERRLAERAAARDRKEKERLSRRDRPVTGAVTPPGVFDPSPSPSPSPSSESESSNQAPTTPIKSARRSKGKSKTMPFSVKEALETLATAADGRVLLSKPTQGVAIRLNAVVRAYPNLETWRLVGEYLAAGGRSWHASPFAPSDVASAKWPEIVAEAEAWERGGRQPPSRGGNGAGGQPPAKRATSPASTKEEFDRGPRTL